MTSKRLWLGVGATVLFLASLWVGIKIVHPDERNTAGKLRFGHDFIGFYTAGRAVLEGRWPDVYRPEAEMQHARATLAAANVDFEMPYAGWLYPPFVAPAYAPFAAFDYRTAVWLWTAFSIACAAGASWLLVHMLPAGTPWHAALLVPVLVLISMPFVLAIGHAQNAAFSLLVLAGAVTLWRADRLLLAGLVASILMYKPQLGAVVALAMVLIAGRRALIGLLIGGAALAIACEWTMPGSIGTYLARLPQNVEMMREGNHFPWHRHATPGAFFHRLLADANFAAWLARAVAGAFALAVLVAIVRRRGPRDALIAASIAAMPMMMPYFVDYDLMLLAVPLALVAPHARSKALAGVAIAWYLGLYVATGLAAATPVNLNVPTTAALAATLLAAALRPPRAAAASAHNSPPEVLHALRPAA